MILFFSQENSDPRPAISQKNGKVEAPLYLRATLHQSICAQLLVETNLEVLK